jgi:eukaryotic-like serine/threonine-protein kinase
MNPQLDKLETVFDQARRIDSPADLERYLASACGADQQFRQQVEAMLRDDARAQEFFGATESRSRPASRELAGLVHGDEDRMETAGTVIGRYKLLEKIGEGGMGVVYMAEQEEPVRRKVALKIIKLGMDTKQVVARFEAERQALALMDHPNIAKVLDGGATAAGRPYFVMELVQGVPITEFCDSQRLSIRERARLLVPVCQAIQSAHQKGIIHRDIKPTNILVTMNAGAAHPMVIDFGVAKATDQKLTEKTLFTRFAVMIGTPAYMSPEQAEMSRMDVDTRSDIYSLGVLFYELLTGSPPFSEERLRSAGYNEMQRIIVEEEPERPSTRLRRKEVVGSVERQERGERSGGAVCVKPSRSDAPRSTLPTDIDWIVMRCLEKDRARRYETANGLAEDIQRYLANEPIAARPPAKLYRLQKAVRRNKTAFLFAIAAAVVLIVAAAISLRQAIRATRAERTQAQTARFLEDMLKSVGPSVALGRDTTLMRDILEKTGARVGKDLKDQPEVEANLLAIIGGVYSALGDYTNAESRARAGLSIRTGVFGVESLPAAESLNALGKILLQQGRLVEAEELERRSLAIRERLFGSSHADIAKSLNDLAVVIWDESKFTDAEPLMRQALTMRKKLLGDENFQTVESLDNLAGLLSEEGRLQEAEAMMRQSVALNRRLLGPEHPDLAISMNNLADTLNAENKFAEAEATNRLVLAMRRKLLGDDHPDVAASFFNLATSLQGEGRLPEAEAAERECLAIRRKRLGNDHIAVAGSLNNLFGILVAEGKLKEAEVAQREALAIQRKKLSQDHQDVAGSLLNLGNLLVQESRFSEAEPFQQEELAIWRRRFNAETPPQPATVASLADVYGRTAAALFADKKFARSAQLAQEFEVFAEKHLPNAWQAFYARSLVGANLLGEGKRLAAEPLLASSYEGMKERARIIPAENKPLIRDFVGRVSQMFQLLGEPDIARRWATNEFK